MKCLAGPLFIITVLPALQRLCCGTKPEKTSALDGAAISADGMIPVSGAKRGKCREPSRTHA